MKILFDSTIPALRELCTALGLPIRPPPGWRYISQQQGVRPWLGIGNNLEVYGIIPTDPRIVAEWKLRGITRRSATEMVAAIEAVPLSLRFVPQPQ